MKSDLYIRPFSSLCSDIGEVGLDDIFGLCTLSDAQREALKANPNRADETEPVQVLGLVDNKVVGQETVFPVRVKANGKVYTAMAGSGLYVHEDYRKSMLGVSLITKREELSADGIALGCGLSQLALPAHLMFDYLCFSLPRLMWMFKSRAVIEKKLGRSPVSRLVSGFVDGLLWLVALVFKAIVRFRTRGLVVEKAVQADDQVARLINQDSHLFACEHSATWLNWQLNYRFTEDYRGEQKLFVVRDKDRRLMGFFMYKVRFHETASQRGYKNLLLGSLMEWQSADPHVVSHATLALMAVLEMRKDGVDAVEVCTDDEPMLSDLRKMLFPQVGDLSFVLRATEASPLRQCEGWDNQKNWRLRPCEGDNGLS